MWKKRKIFALIINVSVVFLFLSQSLCAGSLHFIAYGDTRCEINTMEKPQVKHNAIAKVIREMSPDFILFTGDMVYYNEFGKFIEVINKNFLTDKALPVYPVIGNHELIFGERLDKLIKAIRKNIDLLNMPQEDAVFATSINSDIRSLQNIYYMEVDSIDETELKKRSRHVLIKEFKEKLPPAYSAYMEDVLKNSTEGQSWYSFIKEINGLEIKFIALNSSLPGDDEQFRWFIDELIQFNGPKIIFEHYPPYSTGFHGCNDLLRKDSKASRFRDRYTKVYNDPLNDILLIICGHEHNYQRIYRIGKAGRMQLPVYIISGGGGAEIAGPCDCDVTQIPFDDFVGSGITTAYNFVDISVDYTNDRTLVLNCKVLGLRCDVSEGLPTDDIFEKQFVKDRLELIDNFTLNWRGKCR